MSNTSKKHSEPERGADYSGEFGRAARQGGGDLEPPPHVLSKRSSRSPGSVPPRHDTPDVAEHEDERLNPGASGPNQTGAGKDKPSSPSNSA